MQEPVLFARSVRRNICYGLEVEDGIAPADVPSAEDVERAARLANAHDFITAMPQGYDTVRCCGGLPFCGEWDSAGGRGLSCGGSMLGLTFKHYLSSSGRIAARRASPCLGARSSVLPLRERSCATPQCSCLMR